MRTDLCKMIYYDELVGFPKERGMDIAKMVQEDIEARAQLGEKKYGGRLTIGSRNNMISPLQNAYEEALDLAMYLKQQIEEDKI